MTVQVSSASPRKIVKPVSTSAPLDPGGAIHDDRISRSENSADFHLRRSYVAKTSTGLNRRC
jgi:hypothetical protein